MNDPNKKRTMTIPEAAKLLGISRGHAYQLAQEGRFPCPVIHAGRSVRVPRAAMERLLQDQDVYFAEREEA